MKHLAFAILFTLPWIGLSAQNETENKSTMPSIVLKDVNGKEVDLQKICNEGKITLVDFWATWCIPCKKELDNLNDVADEWKTKYNVQLIAVSIDDSRNAMKVKPFVESKKWTFPVLLDVNQDTKRTFNYPNIPYTLLIDGKGNIVSKHIGYTEGDELVVENEIKKLIGK